MNYAKLVEHHIENHADLTVGALRVPASRVAAVRRDRGRRATSGSSAFEEKPADAEVRSPATRSTSWPRWASTSSPPASSSSSSASTPPGPAATTTSAATSSPRSSTRTACSPIPFRDENRKQDAYWRDVGTLDAYYEANMDLISVDPQLNMYDERLADPHLPAEPAAAEVRLRRGGPERPPRPGARQHRLPGLHRLRRPGRAVDRRARLPHQQLRPRARIRSCSTASTSAGTPRSAGRSSTRACTFPPASRSATTTSSTAPAASPSPTAA